MGLFHNPVRLQTRSFGGLGPISGLPESGYGWTIYGCIAKPADLPVVQSAKFGGGYDFYCPACDIGGANKDDSHFALLRLLILEERDRFSKEGATMPDVGRTHFKR
jgi:hypothetical protein